MAQAILMGKDGGSGGGKGIKVLEASTSNVIDFNTLTEPGYYLIKNCGDNTNTLNSGLSIGSGPLDIVMNITTLHETDGTTKITQRIRYYLRNHVEKVRMYNDEAWSAWEIATTQANWISAGTFAGKMVANASAVSNLTNSQVRNIYAGTTDLTAGTSTLATGDIYLCYE